MLGAAIWEVLGWGLGLQWLPPFSQVIKALVQFLASGVILANLQSSLSSLIIGFALSLVFGLLLGALMGFTFQPFYEGLEARTRRPAVTALATVIGSALVIVGAVAGFGTLLVALGLF